jgi:hypothetical protein
MLRARSGESQAAKPPAVDEVALAEMGRVVADARAEITRLMQVGELQNDPIRHPIQALSVHLDALYKVTRASSQMLAEQIQASAQQIPAGPPVRDEDLRRALRQGIATHATGAERALSVRAGLLLAAVLAGVGAGYWFGQNAEARRFVQIPAALGVALTGPDAAQWLNLMRLNDIGKVERICGAQAGGVTCAISFWVTPPTANSNPPQR